MYLFQLAISPFILFRNLTHNVFLSLIAPFRFTRNIALDLDFGAYQVKTASNWFDFIKVLRLRYLCFIEEEGLKRKLFRLDWDKFDFKCDHLLIVDKENQEVIGTYRLNCSLFNEKFYSSKEFDLANFLQSPGVKVELGRACVKGDKRGGQMVDLLWKGLAKYIKATGARYLFGCSSFFSTDPIQAATLLTYLQEKELHGKDFEVRTLDRQQLPALTVCEKFDTKLIPPLLRTYMAAGAQVYGAPFYDAEFECFDFFTVVDTQNISRLFQKRYFQ